MSISRHLILARLSLWWPFGLSLRVWLTGCALAVGCLSPITWAQEDALASIDAIVSSAERDNRAALQRLQAWGDALGPAAPYAVRREYWVSRVALEMDAGRSDAAAASARALQRLALELEDEVGQVMAASWSASLTAKGGQPRAALQTLAALEPRVLRTGDVQAQWLFYRVKGNAQLQMSQFEPALQSLLKCLALAQQHQRRAGQARLAALNSLSNLYSVMKNPEKALGIIQEALTLAQELQATKTMATLYLNQGVVYTQLGRDADFQVANERALHISRQSGLTGIEATALNNLGDRFLRLHDYLRAESLARQALDKYRQEGDQSGAATAQANIGFALMGQGRVADGAAQVRAALRLFHDSQAQADEEGVLAELAAMYEKSGLYREALAVIREQQALAHALFKAERSRAVAELQEAFDSAQRQKQMESLAWENQLQSEKIANQRLQQLVVGLGGLAATIAGAFVWVLYHNSRKLNHSLRETNRQLEYHAVRDPLTGLFNRRSFLALMKSRPVQAQGDRRAEMTDFPDSLMLFDIDHFKHINDTLGHATGDAVLVEVARRMLAIVRDTDMVMRWGGEEFLVYSPKANPAQLRALAERLLSAVGAMPVVVGEQRLQVSVTGGFLTLPLADIPESRCNWEKALQIADMALYLGKVHGRNRAYGLTQLKAPADQALPLLEVDLAGAMAAGYVELVEVLGPSLPGAALAGAGEPVAPEALAPA